MTHTPGHANDNTNARVEETLEDQELDANELKGGDREELGEVMGDENARKDAGGRPSEDGDADADIDEKDAGVPHERSRDVEKGEL